MKLCSFMLVSCLLLAVPATAEEPTPIPEADSPDARVYANSCGSCHSIPHPKRQYLDQWRHLLDLMYRRVSERNLVPISDEDHEAILRYLTSNAR